MTIDWWTLGLQAVNFLVLVWLLKRFLFQPVRQVIERREALSAESARKLEEDRQAALAAQADYEAKAADLAKARLKLREEVLGETARDRERIVSNARAEASEIADAARSAVAEERQRAVADLKREIAGLAGDMAAKLLAKAAPDIDDAIFLQQLEAKLAGLGQAELERMRKADAAGSRGAAIVTARPLAKDAREQWRRRIAGALGTEVEIEFSTDPNLIAGAELHFSNATVRATWAAELEQAEAAVNGDG
jgi:F-type H+-transporting ATPase subunit b